MAGTRTEVSNSSSFTYSSGAGTSTFSSMSLGTADADRVIVAACTWERHAPTACTINGVTATQVVTADSGTVSVSQLWVAEVPTGTSGDVVFTVPGNASFGACTLWRSTDIDATADDSDSDSSVGSGSGGNTTLNVPAGGVVFAASYLRTTGTATWTGPTEDYAVNTNGRDNSHASSEEASADSAFDCDVSWSASSNVSVVSAVFPEAAGAPPARRRFAVIST